MPTTPRIQPVDRASITDPELLEILAGADRTGAPPASWHLVMAHHPELAKARAAFWEYLFRGGLVEHHVKEQVRILVAGLQACDFCSTARSTVEDTDHADHADGAACAMPITDHSSPRTQAALRYARALTLGVTGTALDEVYVEVGQHYSPAEVLELGCLVAHVVGGTTFVRSLDLEGAQVASATA